MINRNLSTGICKMLAIGVLALFVASCSKNPEDIDSAGLSGTVSPGTERDFFVNVGDRVFFSVDSSVLSSASIGTLGKQAQWLKQYPQITVTVEGHADERGTRQYNIALGARRANAVRDYLIGQGISADRIKTISYGKERPTAVCNDETCWSQNRKSVTAVNSSNV